MKNFGLIGAAGYIAPRHMKAIKDTENNLLACMDPNDSVGIIDSFFPEAKYFNEFERFDRFIEKERRNNNTESLDFLSICSPNYLHDSHIRFGLRSNLNVICEKPIVLNPWNIDSLLELEKESNKTVSSVLQLRYHPSIIELKKSFSKLKDRKYEVDLTYITGRGNWYLNSWKGNIEKSGGISTNIGVHFFDMLHFLFGKAQENVVYLKEPTKESGYLEFENARVRWFLSIDASDIRHFSSDTSLRTFRSISYDGIELEFSNVFNDLHTEAYKEILKGNGYGLKDSLQAIEIVSKIRNSKVKNIDLDSHPYFTK